MKSQETKRAEAEARQTEHGALNTIGKLTKIAGRRGESKREKQQLLDELDDAALDEFD